jgi:polyisoprenoid-binding protein YceI
MSTTIIKQERAASGRWPVESDGSFAHFAVKTFWGLVTVRGGFQRFDGSYEVDPHGASIEMVIDADSIDTGNEKRDGHLRSADFFGIAEHPQVRFTSTSVRDAGDGLLQVEGHLEAAGRVVPLQFDAALRKVDDELQLEATTAIDPRDFGMHRGLLAMIRPPARLHVKARLGKPTEEPDVESLGDLDGRSRAGVPDAPAGRSSVRNIAVPRW